MYCTVDVSKTQYNKENFKDQGHFVVRPGIAYDRFDLTAIEYKPFTRFTIAKSLDDLSQNKLSILLNRIINDVKL